MSQQLALAKTRSRFFFAGRENTVANSIDASAAIVKEGYQRTGFKYVKAVYVPANDMTVWSSYPASWFEEGIQFLDATAQQANAPSAKSQAAPPDKTSGAAAPPPASPDDANRKAASALSLARNYINAGQYDAARKKLQSILQTYPNTPAAADAQTLLKQIEGK